MCFEDLNKARRTRWHTLVELLDQESEEPPSVAEPLRNLRRNLATVKGYLEDAYLQGLAEAVCGMFGFFGGFVGFATLAVYLLHALWLVAPPWQFLLLWLFLTPLGFVAPFYTGAALAALCRWAWFHTVFDVWASNVAIAHLLDGLDHLQVVEGIHREERRIEAAKSFGYAAAYVEDWIRLTRSFLPEESRVQASKAAGAVASLSRKVAFPERDTAEGVRNLAVTMLGDMAAGNYGSLAARAECDWQPPRCVSVGVMKRTALAVVTFAVPVAVVLGVDRLVPGAWPTVLAENSKVLLAVWSLYSIGPLIGVEQERFGQLLGRVTGSG